MHPASICTEMNFGRSSMRAPFDDLYQILHSMCMSRPEVGAIIIDRCGQYSIYDAHGPYQSIM